jgi:hypothetical protein
VGNTEPRVEATIAEERSEPTPLIPIVTVRVVIRCPTIEQFVEDYHRFVKGDRIFIVTNSLQPVGTKVRFRMELADGTELLHGAGTVTRTRPRRDEAPDRPPGMVLRFVVLDEQSQHLVDKMAERRARGAAEGVVQMEAPPANSDEVMAATQPVPSSDETTAPFRVLGVGTKFAEAWRSDSLNSKDTVPANPFSDISDDAIEYFVEWSLEWNRTRDHKPASVRYQRVNMELPLPATAKRARAWFPFVAGGLAGALLALTAAWIASRLHSRASATTSRPAIVMPVKAVATVATIVNKPVAPAPPSPPPEPSARAAVPADDSASAPANGADTAGEALTVLARPDADVRLDGKDVGRTPLFLSVSAGRHEVELTRQRYQTRTLPVMVPGRVDVTLLRPTAKLHVTSSPSGAEVRIDGEPRGRTPVDVEVDAFEHYPIEMVLSGHRSWHKRFYVRSTNDSVHAQLETAR